MAPKKIVENLATLSSSNNRPLPDSIKSEWADPREPTRTPLRDLARWKCSRGHVYQDSREGRERYGRGCPKCSANPRKRKPGAKNAPTATPQLATAPPAAPHASGGTDPTTFQKAPSVAQGASGAGQATAAPVAPAAAPKVTAKAPAGPLLVSAPHGIFWVRDTLGVTRNRYTWRRILTATGAPAVRRAHHIFIFDRSGSTYYDIDGMRTMVKKLLAVEEFKRPNLFVSVVSYSSKGDTIVHFSRVRADEVGPIHLAAIDGIRASGLTCMSGGIEAAARLKDDREDTTITLHSDGYANDASASEERQAILCRLIPQLRGGTSPAVVNTIAYRSSSDFGFLAQIANLGGGACVQAGRLDDVYDALSRSHRATLSPSKETMVDVMGAAYLMRVRRELRRVILTKIESSAPIQVDSGDEIYLIHKNKIDDLKIDSSSAFPCDDSAGIMLAMARGMIGLRCVTLAKWLALSSGVEKMTRHARALTSEQIASMTLDVESEIFDAATSRVTWQAPVPQRTTLPSFLAALAKHRDGVSVDVASLALNYRRRGVKRVSGRWVKDQLVAPSYDVVNRRAGAIGSDGWADLVSVEMNASEATVNMTVAQPVDLIETASGRTVGEVAGITLDKLQTFRAYTLISDGEVNLPMLSIRITRREAHAALSQHVPIGGFNPTTVHNIDLTQLQMLAPGPDPGIPSRNVVASLFDLTILQKILSASLKGEADATPYTSEQIEELKARHITPKLYFSPPTTYAYPDLKRAQVEGLVDSRLRYRVTFGIDGVLSTGDLPSANEYLRRRWEIVDGAGKVIAAPTCADLFKPEYRVREKTAEQISRLKMSPIDALMMPIFRLAENKCASTQPVMLQANALGGGTTWRNSIARAQALRDVETLIESVQARMRDVVFFVGASGTVPEGWGPSMDANGLRQLFPNAVIPSAAADAEFWFGRPSNVIVTVRAEESLYSVK